MSSKARKKPFEYRHIIAVGITLGVIAVAVLCFPLAFKRLLEVFCDLGLSLGYYFAEIFKIPHSIEPTVTEFSSLPFTLPFNLPETWEEFKVAFSAFWALFADMENFRGYLLHLAHIVSDGSRWIVLLLPVVVLFWFLLCKMIVAHNNRYGEETRPLKIFKRVMDKTYRPAKAWVLSFIDFMKAHSYYVHIWVWAMAYAFGWIAIVVEFFAYYFFFVIRFEFGTIYKQIVKLLYDLSPMLNFVPGIVWAVVGYIVFDKIRQSIALARLHHMEMMNRGFIAERPIVLLTVGTMGKKKTTLTTDMSLSLEVMFRDKSLERLREADMKFPYFPWINFENSIRRGMEEHRIYNLVTCKAWVRYRQGYFERIGTSRFIFDYDFKRYGMTYDNAMYIENIWDVPMRSK